MHGVGGHARMAVFGVDATTACFRRWCIYISFEPWWSAKLPLHHRSEHNVCLAMNHSTAFTYIYAVAKCLALAGARNSECSLLLFMPSQSKAPGQDRLTPHFVGKLAKGTSCMWRLNALQRWGSMAKNMALCYSRHSNTCRHGHILHIMLQVLCIMLQVSQEQWFISKM